tara:strand:+ start:12 stop:191 length:180 start_codon:yes stop_codon:yes gene_type:complete
MWAMDWEEKITVKKTAVTIAKGFLMVRGGRVFLKEGRLHGLTWTSLGGSDHRRFRSFLS